MSRPVTALPVYFVEETPMFDPPLTMTSPRAPNRGDGGSGIGGSPIAVAGGEGAGGGGRGAGDGSKKSGTGGGSPPDAWALRGVAHRSSAAATIERACRPSRIPPRRYDSALSCGADLREVRLRERDLPRVPVLQEVLGGARTRDGQYRWRPREQPGDRDLRLGLAVPLRDGRDRGRLALVARRARDREREERQEGHLVRSAEVDDLLLIGDRRVGKLPQP